MRGTLVNDLDNIINLYIYRFTDTVTLAKMYNVSSSAVSEILRRNNITNELREKNVIDVVRFNSDCTSVDDMYSRVCQLFNIPFKRFKYILKKHKVVIKQNNVNKTNIIKLLKAGYTIQYISRSLNYSYSTVRKIAKDSNIEPGLIQRFKQLVSKTELEAMLGKMSCLEIGKKYGVYSKDVVIRAAKDYQIHFGISPSTKRMLLNKKWCEQAYNQHKSYLIIASLLGDVGADTVSYYLQIKHKIPKILLKDEFPMLNDKTYVESIYKNQSIAGAAGIVGCTPWLFKEFLIKHEIPIKNDFQTSIGEHELVKFIKSLGITVVCNERSVIAPKELDIVCHDHNIAIEYCGVYYHSSKFKDRNYHKEKLEATNRAGYRLITIFEHEWQNHKDIVKKKISNIFHVSTDERIYARNTSISLVSEADARIFLQQHHIQGFTKASVRLGLFFNQKLVALMCLKKEKEMHYNLVRFASSCNVIGGFTKLLSAFKRNYDYNQIVTFADLRWSQLENMYSMHGFVKEKVLNPAFMWVSRGGVYRREKFMKSKQSQLLKTFDPALTEEENCFNNNIFKLYDCGKIKYTIRK